MNTLTSIDGRGAGARGLRPNDLRLLNAREVLDVLLDRGPLSRADLTRQTGISAPTMSQLVGMLERARLLEEESVRRSTAGRPAVLYRLARNSRRVAGIALDVHECAVAVAGLDGRLVPAQVQRFRTPNNYAALIKTIGDKFGQLTKGMKMDTLCAAISAPGLIDSAEGRIMFSPNLHFTDGRPLARDLSERLGLPCHLMQENECLCAAHRLTGAGRNVQHFVMMDLSEGLGFGVVAGGHYLHGSQGFAGELGHLTVVPDGERCGCGNRGCLETVATDRAVARAVGRRLGLHGDPSRILDALREGSIDGTRELNAAVEFLAIGLAAAVNIFNPDRLLVRGRFLSTRPELFAKLVQRTRERALAPSAKHCEIVQVTHDKIQGALAAAASRGLATGSVMKLIRAPAAVPVSPGSNPAGAAG